MTVLQSRASCQFRAARSAGSRQAVRCAALPHTQARRAVLLSTLMPAFVSVPKAWALIIDEEDEEMVEKAKANRAKRLAEQRATTRTFMAEGNLTDRSLSQDLVPVQKAVYKLAESGSQLESGDVKAASRTMGEGWVAEFQAAASKVSTSSPDAVLSKLTAFKSAADQGDLKASKRSYVELVDAVQAWAAESSLAGSLKGLCGGVMKCGGMVE